VKGLEGSVLMEDVFCGAQIHHHVEGSGQPGPGGMDIEVEEDRLVSLKNIQGKIFETRQDQQLPQKAPLGDLFERAPVHLVRPPHPGPAGGVKIEESTGPIDGMGAKKLGGSDVTNPASWAEGASIR